MTLQANAKVYTSDQMHLTPASDSQIYSLNGDWVMRGLELDVNGSELTLNPGTALVQGRLLEIGQAVTITNPITAGQWYFGLAVDLTQTNTVGGDGEVTNNQFTLVAQSTGATGNLLTGDTSAFIPLWSGSGTTKNREVYLYQDSQTFQAPWPSGSILQNTSDGYIKLSRTGNNIKVYISVQSALPKWDGSNVMLLPAGAIKRDLLPDSHTYLSPIRTNYGLITGVGFYAYNVDNAGGIAIYNGITRVDSVGQMWDTSTTHPQPANASIYGTMITTFRN